MIKPGKSTKLLSEGYDFIVCRHQAIPAMGIQEDYRTLVNVLRSEFPQYYDSFVSVYGNDGSSNRCNGKNTFIATGKEFKEYCGFLFSVLKRSRQEIGDVEDRKTKRYAALFAERLFTAYLLAKDKKIYEVDIVYDRIYLTVAKIIINRLPFSGNSTLLKKLRIKFNNSSYLK